MLKYNMKSCLAPFLIIFLFLLMYTSVIIYMYDPKIADMFDAYREMMPEMMAAMGMSGVAASLLEWMKVYLYGFIMLLFPLIFIIVAVNKLVMSFIDNGSLAGILATSNSRGKIIVTQFLSLILWLLFLMTCMTVVGIVSAQVFFPGDLDIVRYLALNAGTFTLWYAVAGIAFFASCVSSDSKYYYCFGAGIPILLFFLNMLAGMGENLEFLKYMTIYTLLPADGLIAGDGEAIAPCFILFIIGSALFAAGGVYFTKRDLSL